MVSTFKYLIPRLFAIAFILISSNYIYKQYVYQEDLNVFDAELRLKLEKIQGNTDVLYLGESSNFSFHPNDTQRLKISELIAQYFPEHRFDALNKGAYHADLYNELLQLIPEESAIKTVVVTINLRTLNQATIHAPLETSLQMQKRLFANAPPLLNRLGLTFNNYDNKTVIERDKAMWHDWTFDTLRSDVVQFPAPTIKRWCELTKFPDSNGIENMPMRTLADHNIKAFAFQINANNPRIVQLDNIVKTCESKNLKLAFLFLAENMEYADSLVGAPLIHLMSTNRDFLKNRYESQDVLFIDNLSLVPGRHFTDQHWTTEHYDEVGRQIIAKHSAQKIRPLLSPSKQ